jgi:hypothetical protein
MLIIILGWKNLQGTNTLAYFAKNMGEEEKRFITLTPGANVIKLFSSFHMFLTK